MLIAHYVCGVGKQKRAPHLLTYGIALYIYIVGSLVRFFIKDDLTAFLTFHGPLTEKRGSKGPKNTNLTLNFSK